jgi:hypothetical protein
MSPQQPRIPDADIVLPNGAHLTLYRDVKLTLNKDSTKLVGDYLIALVPGEPRAVLYFYQRDGKQKVEMVYTDLPKAVTEEWDDVPPKKDDIPPENLHWTLCSIDDPTDVKRYTALYDAIRNHP